MTNSSRPHSRTANFLLAVIVIINILELKACYISDCPNSYFWNGKRQPQKEKEARSGISVPVRKCPPCGLRMTGQCFNARMCCTPALGCIVGENEITEPCRQESQIPLECASAGPTCIRRDTERGNAETIGVCAADGLCCNEDGCNYHHACLLSQKSPGALVPTDDVVFQSLIGSLMQKIKGKSKIMGYADSPDVLHALQEYRRSSQGEKSAAPIDEQGMY